MRAIVREGYEKIDYEQSFRLRKELSPFEADLFEQFCSCLPSGARVLDLGCGPGIPYDLHLARRGYSLTGVDFCMKHLRSARRHVPQARLICGDISDISVPDESFQAALSLYTIFHLPRESHKEMFRSIYRTLEPVGVGLLTLGTSDSECGEETDWLGARMVWSSFLPTENEMMLQEANFRILGSRFEGTPDDEEYHWWVLVKKNLD